MPLKVLKSHIWLMKGKLVAVLCAVLLIIVQINFNDLLSNVFPHHLGSLILRILVLFFFGYMLDKSYKSKVNHQLDKEVYRSLFDHNLDASYTIDLTGHFKAVNEATLTISGYSKEELLVKEFITLVPFEERNQVFRAFKQVITKGQSVFIELSIIRKDGEVRKLQVSGVPIFVDGNIQGCIGIAKDVTEQEQAVQQIQSDLRLAKEIQKGLLPPSLTHPGIGLKGFYRPSEDLSGDTYFWTRVDNDRYGVIITDVVGHGVASSLICMSFLPLLKGLIEDIQNPVKVTEELVKYIQTFYAENVTIESVVYFTAFYMLIDTKKREIEYVCSGHPPAKFVDLNENLSELCEGTVPIGLLPLDQMPPIEKGHLHYEAGSKIYLYTDGLSDLFGGLREMTTFMNELNEANQLDNAFHAFIERIEKAPILDDDITLVEVSLS